MKPIAWRHMAFWGAIHGAVGGGIFALITLLTGLDIGLVAIIIGMQLGMTLGIMLGFISGFLIETLLPIESRELKQHYSRYTVITMSAVALLCLIASYPLVHLFLDSSLFTSTFPWDTNIVISYLPSIFASIGSAYATRQYLERLREYNLPARKTKDIVQKMKRLEIPKRQSLDAYLYNQPEQQRRQNHE